MKFKFLHFSDAHLGYQQYNHKERFNDFGRAFLYTVDQAIARKVDFVISAGDLFQKRTVDPMTLMQAVEGLKQLREAGIPVFAVEGNHERAPYRDVFSWTDFLARQGYLIMLNPSFEDGEPILKPWDGKQGAYVDFNPDSNADVPGAPPSKVVRIYGVKYLGSATSRVVDSMIEALASMDHSHIDFSILTMHAGLDDVLDHLSATVPYSQFAPLKDYVNYLALGHVHKPYEREDWIFNPGPLETCSMTEVSWPHRGYYLVEVDTNCEPQHRAELIPIPRRGFVRVAIDVDTCRNPEELYSLAERHLKSATPTSRSDLADPLRQPVVEIRLRGVLPFRFQDLDLKRLESLAWETLDPLLVRIANHTVPTGYEISSDESKPRVELEHEVIRDLVEQDSRFRPDSADWANIILDVKRMSLDGTPPKVIVERLASYELISSSEY